MTTNEKALALHEKWNGKMETVSKVPVKSREDLALAYTPGVAEPCKVIAQDKEAAYTYTIKANTIAVVSDGSAVLGLGNIGPYAAMPVMEGKAVLFKEFAGRQRRSDLPGHPGYGGNHQGRHLDRSRLRRHQSGRHQRPPLL